MSLTQSSSEPALAASEPEPEPRTGRDAPGLIKVLIVVSFAMVPILRPGLPQNLAFVDPFIMATCFLSLVWMTREGSPATLGAARALPWIWLILLGSYLGMATVGVPLWGTLDIVRTSLAFATFFCFWHIIHVVHLERLAVIGGAIGFAITTAALVLLPVKYRGVAFFEHPNYAAHYSVVAGVVLIGASKRRWVKVVWTLCLAITMWKTGSFGALAMLLAVAGVVALRTMRRNTALVALAMVAMVIVGLFLLSPVTTDTPSADVAASEEASFGVSDSFSQDRFEKSQGSRATIWSSAVEAFAQNPTGVGPDGVRNRGIGFLAEGGGTDLEVHADALGYLVERGVFGLVGFIGLWVTFFRVSKPDGLARLLLVALFVAGLFRETMHYRHCWLFLALALVLDARAPDQRDPAVTGVDDRLVGERR